MHALNAYNSLLLGLWMLPANMTKDRLGFLVEMQALPPEQQETWLRESIAFVKLSAEEIGSLITFATDPNGVPYQASNRDNLDLMEIFEICLAVCVEISKIKVQLISEEEQKKNPRRNDRPETPVAPLSGQDSPGTH